MEFHNAKDVDLQLLTDMNVQLRNDEKIDSKMTNEQISERMKGFIENEAYEVSIYEDNDEVIGYSTLKITDNPMYLRQLFVNRKYRNKGYGKGIVKDLIERHEINEIDIDVMAWNESAIHFYEKLGFKNRFIRMRYRCEK